MFCALNADAVKKLDGAQTENLFKKGQILFYEGNPAVGVYCVSAGEVKLSKTGAGGRPQILGIVGPGTLMGHRSLLTNQPHTMTAEALVD
ncbi:MAG TPA: cyclic nucleotide-binding domain-containing protein, partial [Elusimicrobiota bacterium]|nr:cyclic nucleotide-binding domain-containing protein [Elusimicrobiota bacterium]